MSDPTHTRILELMQFNSEVTFYEKYIIANNLCYILHHTIKQSDIDILALNIILASFEKGSEGHRVYTLKFVYGDVIVLEGEARLHKLSTLNGLEVAAEKKVEEISRKV